MCILQIFAFDRTVSRLLEMQSESYLQSYDTMFPNDMDRSWLMANVFRSSKDTKQQRLELIWRRYNWFRGIEIDMPIECLKILMGDLLDIENILNLKMKSPADSAMAGTGHSSNSNSTGATVPSTGPTNDSTLQAQREIQRITENILILLDRKAFLKEKHEAEYSGFHGEMNMSHEYLKFEEFNALF